MQLLLSSPPSHLPPDYTHLLNVELTLPFRIVYRVVTFMAPRYSQPRQHSLSLARRPMRCPQDVKGEEAEAYAY